MTQIALIRHGHTAWNRAGQIQGRTDIPLDDTARAELAGYALPDGWEEADIVSSPLARAAETGALISGRTPQTIDALTEMDWGDWEGKKGLDLKADPASGFRDIEDWGWDYHPPGGESPAEVWGRLQPWVNAVTRPTVAVCHIGIMRVLLARATGWDFSGPPPFRIKRNRLFLITKEGTSLTAEPEPIRLVKRV